MKLFVIHTNKNISLNSLETGKVQRTLRSHLTRNNIDIKTLLNNLNIKPTNCGFCGKEVPFRLAFNIQNDVIEVSGIVPGKNKKYKAPYYCGERNCRGKNLNPNSVEFVKVAYGLDRDDAIKFIHKRNSSPFYLENYLSLEEYSKNQSNFSKNATMEDIRISVEKRSLSGYIKKYGENAGIQKYEETQRKKSHTLDSYIKWYGEYEGRKKWILQKNLRSSVEFFKLEDIIEYIVGFLSKKSLHELQTIPPKRLIEKHHHNRFHKRCEDFQTTLDDIIKHILEKYPHLDLFNPEIMKRTKYGYFSYSNENKLLRSSFERKIYAKLIENGFIENKDFIIEYPYPDSKQRCDFYFPKLNRYVELAGMMNDIDYNSKMKSKSEKYEAEIVEIDNINVFLDRIMYEIRR